MTVLSGTVVNTPLNATERYLAEFEGIETRLSGAHIPWLRAARRRALNRFSETGFPSLRNEDWKYTSLKPIENRECRQAQPSDGMLKPAELAALQYKGLRCHELVFINGCYAETWSRLGRLPAGVRIESLTEVLRHEPDMLSGHIHRYTDQPASAFVALNAAFMTDGVYISLPENTVIEEPIHLLFIATRQRESLAAYPRIFVEAGANTHLTMIESYCSAGETQNLTNTLTEIVAKEHACIEHYKIQRESVGNYHLGNLFAVQGREARVISYSIALGAAWARNDIAVKLDAEGAAVTLNGLYMVSGRQHIDHHTRIDHLKPHTQSEEFYKGVLDGNARAVFNGKVVVHEGAQKTDARQANQNLLLSRDAEVDTKPELQICADDVKCSHGATVGSLDENALFYLRSRGIDKETARGLLTYAFAEAVLKGMGLAPIRACLEGIITPSLTLPLLRGREGVGEGFV